MQLLKELIIPLLIFLYSFSLIVHVFSPYGIEIDDDSESYTYLVRQKKRIEYMRPIVYPFMLYTLSFLAPFKSPQYGENLFFVQSLLMSFSFVLMYLTMRRLRVGIFLSVLFTLLGILYFPLIAYVKSMNPEILFTFFMMLAIYLTADLFIFKSKSKQFLLLLSIMLGIFTKPLLLYFLVVYLFYYLLLLRLQAISSSIFLFVFVAIMIFTIPVLWWIHGTKSMYGTNSFSIIQDINMMGKLIQYDLVDTGPTSIGNYPVKELLLLSDDPNIWTRLEIIENGYNWSKVKQFRYAMSVYGRTVITHNFFSFIGHSLRLIPNILPDEYWINMYICSSGFYNNIRIDRSIMCTPLSNSYYTAAKLLKPVFDRIWLLGMVMSGLTYLLILSRRLKDRIINRYTSYFIFILCCYFILVVSLASYEQYTRILLPIRLVMLVMYAHIIQLLFTAIRSRAVSYCTITM